MSKTPLTVSEALFLRGIDIEDDGDGRADTRSATVANKESNENKENECMGQETGHAMKLARLLYAMDSTCLPFGVHVRPA